MNPRIALLVHLAFVSAMIIGALLAGTTIIVFSIPLNLFLLALAVLATPIPTWFLALNVRTEV